MQRLVQRVQSCKNVDLAIELLYEFVPKSEAIKKAVSFAKDKHDGQFRKSGEAYAIHPILVSVFVAYLGGDEDMIVAGLLHDVIEDTCCSSGEVKLEFNEEVANLVDGLTKIMEIRDEELIPSTSNEKLISSALTFRKMLLVSISDVRVLVIKL